jgi:hypothetical protein
MSRNTVIIVGFEVPAAVVMISSLVWVITPCSPLKIIGRFGGTCLLNLQDRIIRQTRNQRESKWQACRLCSNTKPVVSTDIPCCLHSGAASHKVFGTWGRGGIASGILDLGNGWRSVANFKTSPLFPGERPHGAQWIRARMTPRAGLNSEEK